MTIFQFKMCIVPQKAHTKYEVILDQQLEYSIGYFILSIKINANFPYFVVMNIEFFF
jgi:hypothetical protein